MSIGNNVTKKSLFKNSKVWFFLAGAAAVIGAVFVFFVLQSVTATTTYYVLNKDIPARTQITSELLTPVTTSEGGQPRTALTPGSLAASGQIYSKYALSAGDVVTPTNAGSLTALTKGLPSNYVVASFKADPSIAAGGQVARGDYIDVIAVSDTDSHVFLQRVLVVNASTDLDAGGATADSSGTTTSGDGTTTTTDGSTGDAAASTSVVPTLFTVGISQEDAAKLAVVSKNFSLYVVLSSADSSKNGAKSADIGAAVGDIFSGAVGDSGQGTDNTFGDEASKKSTSSSSTDSSSDSNSSSSTPTDSATTPTDSSTTGTSGDTSTDGSSTSQ